MSDRRIENTIEELMKIVADDLIESRKIYSDMISDDSIPNPTYYADDNHVEKKRNVIDGKQHTDLLTTNRIHGTRGKRIIKKALILAAILIMFMGLFITVSEAARMRFYNASFEEQDNHDMVIWITADEDEEGAVFSDFDIRYIPEGYNLEDSELEVIGEEGEIVFREVYEKDENELVIDIIDRRVSNLFVDNEEMIREETSFDGIQAYYYTDGENTMFIWSDGVYDYILSGLLDKTEYIEISRGIKGIK